MNFQEYKEKAITTKVYAPSVAIPYVLLGLQGEIGEFAEKINTVSDAESTKKELGDILWYIAGIYVELGIESPKDWPACPSQDELTGSSLDIMVHAGTIAEQGKKFLRDDWKEGDAMVFPEERKPRVATALTNLLSQLTYTCRDLFGPDVSLEDIAKENIEKLSKRKEKGVLHGAGDERENN